MKKIIYLIFIIYITACAVQGPISGGPEDISPPELLSVFPENFSTMIAPDQKITLIFSELVNPISIHESLRINNHDFTTKVRGKKVTIFPDDKWNSEFLLDIYFSRNLRDYQNNSIIDPLNLFYSLGNTIPSNKVNGKIIDIEHAINRYRLEDSDVIFEIGLFKIIENERKLIKTIESNSNLEFTFNVVDEGVYTIVAVEDKLIDIQEDQRQRRYSILSENISISSTDSTVEVSLNIAGPVSKENLSSINFINQYYVNYIFTDNAVRTAVIDVIYNHFKEKDFSGDSLELSLPMKNDFESYFTEPFSFIVPEVLDTISPFIKNIIIKKDEISLEFSEPLDKIIDQNLFYLFSDSNRVYLDILAYNDSSLLKNLITISTQNVFSEDSLSIYNLNIEKNIIKDLYGNALQDSIVNINLNNQIEDQEQGTSRIFGRVLHNETSFPIVVALYNTENDSREFTLVDEDHHFTFNSITAGFYFLQCFKNYNLNTETPYPYFPGDWNTSRNSTRFSDIFGPIEVRSNWDIEDININFK